MVRADKITSISLSHACLRSSIYSCQAYRRCLTLVSCIVTNSSLTLAGSLCNVETYPYTQCNITCDNLSSPACNSLLSYQLEDNDKTVPFLRDHSSTIRFHFIYKRSLFAKRKGGKNIFCHLCAKPIVSFLKAIIFRY